MKSMKKNSELETWYILTQTNNCFTLIKIKDLTKINKNHF